MNPLEPSVSRTLANMVAEHDRLQRLFRDDGVVASIRRAEELRQLVQQVAAPYEEIAELRRSLEAHFASSRLLGASVDYQGGIAEQLTAIQAHLAARYSILEEEQSRLRHLYRVPLHEEVLRTSELIRASVEVLRLPEVGSICHSIAESRMAWVAIDAAKESVEAFAKVATVGALAQSSLTFQFEASAALRRQLGDWRDAHLDAVQFATALSSTEFAVGRGFDPELTAFPRAIFSQVLDEAGLTLPPADDDAIKADPVEAELDRLLAGEPSDAMVGVYRVISGLERRIRRFIEARMTAAYGAAWVKQRVPAPVLEGWRQRAQEDQQKGNQPLPLIDYADFMDYVAIIGRRDNWQEVFASTFASKETLQESFKRLHPARLAMAHGRDLTDIEVVFVRVEALRVLNAL